MLRRSASSSASSRRRASLKRRFFIVADLRFGQRRIVWRATGFLLWRSARSFFHGLKAPGAIKESYDELGNKLGDRCGDRSVRSARRIGLASDRYVRAIRAVGNARPSVPLTEAL